MRQALEDEIADRVSAFGQTVVDATDPAALHADTRKTLHEKCYRSGTWEAAFTAAISYQGIIAGHLNAELEKARPVIEV